MDVKDFNTLSKEKLARWLWRVEVEMTQAIKRADELGLVLEVNYDRKKKEISISLYEEVT